MSFEAGRNFDASNLERVVSSHSHSTLSPSPNQTKLKPKNSRIRRPYHPDPPLPLLHPPHLPDLPSPLPLPPRLDSHLIHAFLYPPNMMERIHVRQSSTESLDGDDDEDEGDAEEGVEGFGFEEEGEEDEPLEDGGC